MTTNSAQVQPGVGPQAGSSDDGQAARARPAAAARPAWGAWAAALGAAAVVAWLSTLWMPRGPATQMQVWVALAGGLAVGLAGGLLLRRRWAVWPLMLVYIAVVELTRLEAVGPTVDLPVLNNLYGILALALGRGLHGLIVFPALWLGLEIGRAWALSSGTAGARVRRVISRPGVVVAALLVVGLVLLNAWPARTPPLLDADGRPIPGSLAEVTTVRLGGRSHGLLLRGESADLPVLLYLAGGPGQSDLAYPRVLLDAWTDQFVVVAWDQGGTGKSYAALDPTSDFTLARAVDETIAISEHLRARFGEEKIYLLGESWGSTLGVLAAQKRPDLYHAVIGSGQMVSQRETDRILYHQLLAWADAHGDSALRTTLEAYGEPPYTDLPWANVLVAAHYSDLETPYTPPASYLSRAGAAKVGLFGSMASEYTWIERANVLRGLIDMFTVMYPQLQEIDFRTDVPRLETPLYVLDGASELSARRDLAHEWFAQVEAPLKRLYTFEDAGHAVAFEQFEALDTTVLPEILAETSP